MGQTITKIQLRAMLLSASFVGALQLKNGCSEDDAMEAAARHLNVEIVDPVAAAEAAAAEAAAAEAAAAEKTADEAAAWAAQESRSAAEEQAKRVSGE